MTQPTVQQLSNKFINGVLADATEAERAAILAHPKDDPCCNTHDFMDSNQVMLDAYEALTGEEPDISDDEIIGLFNAAWSLSRLNGWQPA